jgi:hypothetical protein
MIEEIHYSNVCKILVTLIVRTVQNKNLELSIKE